MNIINKLQKELNSNKIDPNFDLLDTNWTTWKIGDKIEWCYKEDVEFWKKEFSEEIKDFGYFECFDDFLRKQQLLNYDGILIALPDTRFSIESAIVCVYDYPVEKCYPEVDWVSLVKLIDKNSGVYRVFKQNSNI